MTQGGGGQPSWVVGALGGPGSGAVQALRARCEPSVRRFVHCGSFVRRFVSVGVLV